MEAREINVMVVDKIATADSDALYVCGNSDYAVVFNFDGEWDEHESKTARFSYNGSYTDVVFQGNECPVPVLSDVYGFKVGVFAGNLRTSTPAYVAAKKSILCENGSPTAPTEDVYNQLMALINDLSKDGVTDEAIQQAVAKYMAENPAVVEEIDPTVPEWAKQPEKPTYTAEEIGAQPMGSYALEAHMPIVEEDAQKYSLVEESDIADVIRYTPQALSPNHQEQARANIGAADVETVNALSEEIGKLSGKEEAIEVKIEATTNDIIDGNYIGSDNEIRDAEPYVCTKPIPISFNPGETLTVRCTIIGNAALVFLDNTQNVVLAINGTNASAHGITAGVNLQIISIGMPENAKYIRMSGLKTATVTMKDPYTKPSDLWVSGLKKTSMSDMVAALGDYIHGADLLYGKKLAVCGDSITEATNPEGGYFKNYAEIVADRHGMTVYKDGKGGSTMANSEGRLPFCVDRYTKVPEYDILTIWFGWNDATYSQIGTIEDTEDTTYYGAYKKVLEYFIATYPTKKIGLIVPYGNASVEPFRVAVRALSEMYGVPCLDLADGKQCSLLWGAANAAQEARRAALTYDSTHPNQAGHEYLSTMYEEFIKRL